MAHGWPRYEDKSERRRFKSPYAADNWARLDTNILSFQAGLPVVWWAPQWLNLGN